MCFHSLQSPNEVKIPDSNIDNELRVDPLKKGYV